MEVLAILISLFVAGIVSLALYFRRNRGHLETLGIPIDPPMFMFGSSPWALHKASEDMYTEKHKKFGKTYGRYNGVQPAIVTIDPELVKSIIVKNFDSFHAVFDVPLDEEITTLDASEGVVWRNLRKNMSPTFTSGKLKGMMEPMTEVIDRFVGHLEKMAEDGKEVEVKPILQGLALDVISKCAFSMDTDAMNNPDDDLLKNGRNVFADFIPTNWLETLAFIIPTAYLPIMFKFIPFINDAQKWMFKLTTDIMKEREQKGKIGKDFVARLTELKNAVAKDPNHENHQGLTEKIITAQGTIFFVAGFETTSNTLSTLCYSFAKNPSVQQRAYEEVRDVMERHGGKINHETIAEMEYLEAVIMENLRVHTPVLAHIRVCREDCEIAPGMLIKKGTSIELPIKASHYQPDFFPNPTKFEPERFLKENADQIIPYTYRPFGGGPRVCIGQRFALNEIKITIAKMLTKVEIVDSPGARLIARHGSQFLKVFEDLKIKFVKRQE